MHHMLARNSRLTTLPVLLPAVAAAAAPAAQAAGQQ
jgi:hypothetical protein